MCFTPPAPSSGSEVDVQPDLGPHLQRIERFTAILTSGMRCQGGGSAERFAGSGGERHHHRAQLCHQEHAERATGRPHLLHGRCLFLLGAQKFLDCLTCLCVAQHSVHAIIFMLYTHDLGWPACAAMIKRKKGPGNGELYTDEDWNDEATLADASYAFSKVCSRLARASLSATSVLLLPVSPKPGNRDLGLLHCTGPPDHHAQV